MKRKLVTIQRIDKISPIEGADMIEKVSIKGWNCVAKKGEFQEGDKCIYFEIDSFLPIEERFEFLRASSFKRMGEQEGFRLKTMKLRGVISQGLALPLKEFQEFQELEIGEEVTESLNVVKYDPPVPASISGDVVGLFPSFIPKTDEERIQNLPEYFEIMKDIEFEETLKLDGTSMTVFRTNGSVENNKTEDLKDISGKVGVCMRNYELRYNKDNTMWKTAFELRLPEILDKENLELAFQGELMGNGIQGNREKLKKHDFFVFRIWDIKNRKFLDSEHRKELIDFINKKYDVKINHVPVINEKIKIFNVVTTMEDMLKRADGKSMVHDIREGIVFKSVNQINGNTVTFKAISNRFLLKGGE